MVTVRVFLDTSTMTDVSHPMANASLGETNCILLQFGEYVPWNNPDNIVSSQAEDVMYTLLFLFFELLFLIACPANIINMMVFYKHGLKERINVCLFALSLADEVYMVSNFMWFVEQFSLRFTTKEKYGPILGFITNNYLLVLHGYIWVSQVLSAIIAIERCFCVMNPLRSQSILRTSTMIFIIIVVHVVIFGVVFFETLRYEVICAIDPITGSITHTITASDIYFRYKEAIDFINIFVLGIGLPGMVMIVITASTIITTAKLRQAALWRAGTSSHSDISDRDIALTKMLVANSIFFIICLIPFIIFRLIFLVIPEVNAGGRKHNFYVMCQEILMLISYINSTFNIVIYYTMGSRYRQTCWKLFGKTRKEATKPTEKISFSCIKN